MKKKDKFFDQSLSVFLLNQSGHVDVHNYESLTFRFEKQYKMQLGF